MKLHNEEYLRANIISSVTLITGSIYFISSWSVSSFINIFNLVQAVHILKEYYTCITMEYLIAVLKNKERKKERTFTFIK